MPHAVKQNKGPSTSVLTEEEASHDESSHAARVTRDPSTSMLTETKGEASQDESSTNEESEPEQEVYINSHSSSWPTASLYLYVHAIHRRSKDGLDS